MALFNEKIIEILAMLIKCGITPKQIRDALNDVEVKGFIPLPPNASNCNIQMTFSMDLNSPTSNTTVFKENIKYIKTICFNDQEIRENIIGYFFHNYFMINKKLSKHYSGYSCTSYPPNHRASITWINWTNSSTIKSICSNFFSVFFAYTATDDDDSSRNNIIRGPCIRSVYGHDIECTSSYAIIFASR